MTEPNLPKPTGDELAKTAAETALGASTEPSGAKPIGDKAAEKADRATSETPLLEGIPASLSTLLVADKVLARRERAGVTELPADDGIGSQLLRLVAQARAAGGDADQALRAAVRALATEH